MKEVREPSKTSEEAKRIHGSLTTSSLIWNYLKTGSCPFSGLHSDFTVRIKDGPSTLHKKSENEDIRPQNETVLPTSCKRMKRIREQCSDPQKGRKELKFDNVLKINGYPKVFLTKDSRDNSRGSRDKQNAKKQVYFSLPFIGDKVN